MSENYDQLVHEVVDMVEDDLNHQSPSPSPEPVTVESLKKQFKNLTQAKNHFQLKAASWTSLVHKLNQHSLLPSPPQPDTADLILQRLDKLESSISQLQEDVTQILHLLQA